MQDCIEMIYIIYTPKSPIGTFKVGKWRYDVDSLFERYRTYYSSKLKILYWVLPHEASERAENELLDRLVKDGFHYSNELFFLEGLSEAIRIGKQLTGQTPLEYTARSSDEPDWDYTEQDKEEHQRQIEKILEVSTDLWVRQFLRSIQNVEMNRLTDRQIAKMDQLIARYLR